MNFVEERILKDGKARIWTQKYIPVRWKAILKGQFPASISQKNILRMRTGS